MDNAISFSVETIRQILHFYCRAVDRLDADLLRSIYHDDAICDFGTFRGNAIAMIPAIVARLETDYLCTSHLLHSSAIDVDCDVATAETYFTSILLRANGDTAIEERNQGRYLDRLERRDGTWKIAHRTVVIDSLNASSATPARSEAEIASLHRGQRGREDPLYWL